MITGILFDFNGTLVFDTEYHEKAWRAFLKDKLNREVTDSEFMNNVHGQSNDSIVRYFFGDSLSEKEIFRFGEEKEALYRQMCRENGLALIDGAEALFGQLRKLRMPFAVATSSYQSNVEFYFEHLNLHRWFDGSNFVYNDGTLPGKPAPDIYLRAAGQIGCRPENCIVFEDSPAGIRSASNAGVRKIIGVAPDRKAIPPLPSDTDIPFIGNYREIEIEKLIQS